MSELDLKRKSNLAENLARLFLFVAAGLGVLCIPFSDNTLLFTLCASLGVVCAVFTIACILYHLRKEKEIRRQEMKRFLK